MNMMNNYIRMLCDTSFLDDYKYVSKEEFIIFIKIHINRLLEKIEIKNYNNIDKDKFNDIEKEILNSLINSINLYKNVMENEIKEDIIDNVIYDLVKRKVINDTIDNLILLEEIEYLRIDNTINKLKNIYYYLLEWEIYNYYNIERIQWKNEKQKQYILNKVKYSSVLQNKIKQDIIQDGNVSKKNVYLYNKTIGIISTYPIKELINKYNEKVLIDIYKIKYLLTLDSKLKKCSDNKILEKKNEITVIEHKSFFKELLDKYKKIIEKKDFRISKLEKENNIKQNTIINYANCINEYNNLSWIRKLKRVFKKDSIKLLNQKNCEGVK